MIDHPIAAIFPLMSKGELDELAESIKKNGLLNPITTHEGKILDGRNRYRACKIAGVEPRFKDFKGDSPTSFVLAQNLDRRHLTQSQKAMVAMDVEPFFAKEAKEQQRAAGGDKKSVEADQPQANASEAKSGKSKKREPQAREKAAKATGASGKYVTEAKALEKHAPDLAALVRAGKMTIDRAKKELKKRRAAKDLKEAQAKVSAAARSGLAEVCDIRHCSMKELLTDKKVKPDCIITDPPYPEKFLPLYEELAELAKDVPLVAVMCGQSYLPEIYEMMTKYLKYRWTLAYLTPGGQAVQVWDRKINTFWKPILVFGKAGKDWLGDVAKSDVNDNDKRFHGWGQSESGMGDLVARLSQPGQLVCDPFAGAGTTALVSLRLGRKFIGCDIDKKSVESAIRRVETDQEIMKKV